MGLEETVSECSDKYDESEVEQLARDYLSLARTLISGEDISKLCRALLDARAVLRVNLKAATLAQSSNAAMMEAALSELLRLKAVRDALDDHAAGVHLLGAEWFDLNEDYRRNKPLAWKRAREVMAGRGPVCMRPCQGPGSEECSYPKCLHATQSATRWISVRDRLPEAHNHRVGHLAYNAGGVFFTTVHPSWWNSIDPRGPDYNGPSVTHWMEIPGAPVDRNADR
jgi:hypothetical protein